LLLGCADPASPFEHVADNTGILRVRVTTEGPDVDANGYLVSIDDSRSFSRVAANGSVTLHGLLLGTHALFVTDVAPNCVVDVSEEKVTLSIAGRIVDADLHVTCSALGALRVTVTTTGSDLDANGYRIAVNGLGFTDTATTGVVGLNAP